MAGATDRQPDTQISGTCRQRAELSLFLLEFGSSPSLTFSRSFNCEPLPCSVQLADGLVGCSKVIFLRVQLAALAVFHPALPRAASWSD